MAGCQGRLVCLPVSFFASVPLHVKAPSVVVLIDDGFLLYASDPRNALFQCFRVETKRNGFYMENLS